MTYERRRIPLRILPGRSSPPPFRHYCNQWLEASQPELKPSSFAKYRTQLNKYILPRLGDCTSATFTTEKLEQFAQSLRQDCALAPKSVKDILVLLGTLQRYAGKSEPEYLTAEAVSVKAPRREMRVLSRNEQEILVEHLSKQGDLGSFGILLALLTGMRIGEICALRWEDVSLWESRIQVHATLQRIQKEEGTQVILMTPKSEKSIRSIPLSPKAVELCRRMGPRAPEDYVLTGSRRYMEPRTLQNRLKKHTEACGLEGVHFHTLRHTYATRCMEAGVEIKVLSEILGHASVSITMDRYVHASFELKKENIRKLQAVGM